MTTLPAARRARLELRRRLAGRPGVCGIGVEHTDEEFALRVNVETAEDAVSLPDVVDGVAVRVRVTGPLRPLAGRGRG